MTVQEARERVSGLLLECCDFNHAQAEQHGENAPCPIEERSEGTLDALIAAVRAEEREKMRERVECVRTYCPDVAEGRGVMVRADNACWVDKDEVLTALTGGTE